MSSTLSFQEVRERHRERLTRYAANLLKEAGGITDVEDIMQEVDFKLWKVVEQGQTCSTNWLYLVTRNQVIDVLRRRKIERTLFLPLEDVWTSSESDPEQIVLHKEDAAQITQVAARLPPRVRRVFRLRWEGFSHAEIAAKTSRTVGASKQMVARWNPAFRQMIKEEQQKGTCR